MSIVSANKEIEVGSDYSLYINNSELQTEFNRACADMVVNKTIKRLFEKDPTLWEIQSADMTAISQRLGWITLPDHSAQQADTLKSFASQIKTEAYKAIVLLGMGGSSLCSEVTRETFGSSEAYPELFVLDNTAPSAITDLEKKIVPDKTLFIVASKSGNTKETLSFFHYFYQQVENTGILKPGNNFVAITDDGSPLAKMAEHYFFRKIFTSPADLGGRYAVLSCFGLVPMALTGMDISVLLQNAKKMKTSCENQPAETNPGVSLGIALGVFQKHGRDKITFILSPAIASFGYWLEQLLAESTGKDGSGLIPVNGELPGNPGAYDNDRVFVHLFLSSDDNINDERKTNALVKCGHPIIKIKIEDKMALGSEYYRWEVAASVAGIIMGIDPFDQPNVEESKANTNLLLEGWKKKKAFDLELPLLKSGQTSVYAGDEAQGLMVDAQTPAADFINRFTALATQGDYIAFLPYFVMTEHRTLLFQEWRKHLRDRLKTATTLLNGPRYLHSTGQLHKGGPNTGLYILFTADAENEIAIPGQGIGFATLQMAQALGDFHSLDKKARRVIRIHLGKEIDAELNKLTQDIMYLNKINALTP